MYPNTKYNQVSFTRRLVIEPAGVASAPACTPDPNFVIGGLILNADLMLSQLVYVQNNANVDYSIDGFKVTNEKRMRARFHAELVSQRRDVALLPISTAKF